MASLIEAINQDLVKFQKAKDEIAVSSLRLLISDVKNAQIAKGGELSDAEIVEVIAKKAKRHKESIEAYGKAGRQDLVGKEQAELAVISKYLPKQLTDVEIEKIVDEVLSQTEAANLGDLGKVMGQVMAKVGGQADGGRVSEIVKGKLAR